MMGLFSCLTGCRRTSDGTNVACLVTSRHALLREMRLKMDEDLEKCVIEALPVVSSLCFHTTQKKNKAGYCANLRCGCAPYRFSMQGHHVMFFFYVSGCTEALYEEVVHLLVHDMLACE